MWLFTTIGFFSVQVHRDEPGTIVIRSLVREDLEALRRHHLPDLEIVEVDGYCAMVSRDEWEHASQQLAQSVDYTEFEAYEAMQRVQSAADENSSRSSAADSEHHLG